MDVTDSNEPHVLILGAGIHGAGIARELLLNGVSVHIIDAFDIAFGATSKSSRLIHGGLRYLEYGDFRLVRESLEEQSRLLTLAPQFVTPLRLHIPTANLLSGLVRSAVGFFGQSRTPWGKALAGTPSDRGFWPVNIGLGMYDRLFPNRPLPPSSTARVGTPGTPRVNPQRFSWLSSYSDAQMLYPERFVLALLADARHIAAERHLGFQISNYTRAELSDSGWRLQSTRVPHDKVAVTPRCVVNATGAWGDQTLQQLPVDAPQQFGGTKGTHFATWNADLVRALNGDAVYAEAEDGRLVFVLPFGDGVLVGTTDETFAAGPETAVATEAELDYLLRMVNRVMDCQLTRDDITLHYSGVRPLPKSDPGNNAAISRDHTISELRLGNTPVWTLVGGKLTTWREFSELAADRVLAHLHLTRQAGTHSRPIPGQEKFPDTQFDREKLWRRWSEDYSAPLGLIAALWPLYGTRAAHLLNDCRGDLGTPISDTGFTTGIIRWIIEHEWVTQLTDLVERRLMLVFARQFTRQTLADLAQCLVASRRLKETDLPGEIESAVQRLAHFYGRRFD